MLRAAWRASPRAPPTHTNTNHATKQLTLGVGVAGKQEGREDRERGDAQHGARHRCADGAG